MGSFNATCAISNLPIKWGDPVRYLLLVEKDRERTCNVFDAWEPRTFPIKAKYNDYGSIEDNETGVGPELWLEGLKYDLVEQGWGNNSAHDVPTNVDMTWDQLLEALWEGRVLIDPKKAPRVSATDKALKRVKELLAEEKDKGKTRHLFVDSPEGVPTLRSVKEALSKSPSFTGDWGKDGYMVDELEHAMVRVRWHGKDFKRLEEAKEILDADYATVIASGSGSYCFDEPEVLVFAKPGVRCGRGRTMDDYYRPRKIAPMMIREDVWQAILTLDTAEDSLWNEDKPRKKDSLEDYKAAVRALYEKKVQAYNEAKTADPESTDELLMRSLTSLTTDPSLHSLTHALENQMCLIFGIQGHWELFVAKALPADEVSDTLDAVAELLYVQDALFFVRYLWVPHHTAGPQEGSFNMHEAFHKAMADLAHGKHEEERKQYEEYADR